jgi:hypothetical protein
MSKTPTAISPIYVKRLEGILLTESLKECYQNALTAAAAPEDISNAETNIQSSVATDMHSLSKTNAQALAILQTFDSNQNYMPISILRVVSEIIGAHTVETALQASKPSLRYTPPPPATTSSTKDQFQNRMTRLRLQQEERSYSKLTTNLGLAPIADDITIRSMTYAASIGLNMIVAPITFGVFMYFFGGSLLNYWWPYESKAGAAQATDIRKVIVGVVSGVLMLFIEMILFVIRTHEMDKAMRRKDRKRTVQPFGVYTAASAKNFTDASGGGSSSNGVVVVASKESVPRSKLTKAE